MLNNELQDLLRKPGQTLVFCDDTDIQGQPEPGLKPDLRILVAVEIDSTRYPAIADALCTELKDFGVDEFHATDIATGNGPWKGSSIERREAALRFLAAIVAAEVSWIGATWVSRGQFIELKAQAKALGEVRVGFKQGLKRVFVLSITERLIAGSKAAILVMDPDKPLAAPQVEAWPEATFLVGGGPIAAPSDLVHGLQLADLVAWSVGRYLTKRPGFDDDTATSIDDIAMRVVASMPGGKLHDLLKEDAVSDPTTP